MRRFIDDLYVGESLGPLGDHDLERLFHRNRVVIFMLLDRGHPDGEDGENYLPYIARQLKVEERELLNLILRGRLIELPPEEELRLIRPLVWWAMWELRAWMHHTGYDPRVPF